MASETFPFTLREIVRADDPAWQAWKDIYYASFPVNEQMSEDSFLRVLHDKAEGKGEDQHILVLVPDEQMGTPVGMAYYMYDREIGVGQLWYIATRSESRSKGYGPIIYATICRQLVEDGAKMMVFEVDTPEPSRQQRHHEQQWAQRRINWYKRQGALVLDGIQYFQDVDTGVPPTEMCLMIHPFKPMDAEEAFSLCKSAFGDSLTQTGDLALTQ